VLFRASSGFQSDCGPPLPLTPGIPSASAGYDQLTSWRCTPPCLLGSRLQSGRSRLHNRRQPQDRHSSLTTLAHRGNSSTILEVSMTFRKSSENGERGMEDASRKKSRPRPGVTCGAKNLMRRTRSRDCAGPATFVLEALPHGHNLQRHLT
jgi:hypothetical protein